MTRKKVKVAWIENDAGRRASLKKRRVGLLKKVSELTVLCGVDAFCIIYSPDESEPVVWPSPSTVQQLICRYRDLPEIERCKKAMNQETYLKERIGKAKDQSKKHQKKNKDLDLSCYMQQVHEGRDLDDFDMDELQCFAWLLQERIYDYRKRLDYFQNATPLPPAFIPPQVPNMEDIGLPQVVVSGGDGGGGDGQRIDASDPYLWNQWVYDTMMNNNENVVGGSDTVVPFGFNLCGYGSNFGQMNMGNFYQENTGETADGNANSRLGHPHGETLNGANLEQPYLVGGINSGSNVTRSGIPHGIMDGSLGGLSMIGLLNGTLGGVHNDGNVGISYGNWEGANEGRNFPAMQGANNNNGTNLDHLGLTNMAVNGRENEQTAGFFSRNILGHGNDHCQSMGAMDGLGNAIELDHNRNIVEEHGNEMVPGVSNGNIVRGHGNDQNDEGNHVVSDWNNIFGNCGRSVAGSDVGFQSSLFGVTSDMGLPFDVTKTWHNNHSS